MIHFKRQIFDNDKNVYTLDPQQSFQQMLLHKNDPEFLARRHAFQPSTIPSQFAWFLLHVKE